MKVLDAIFYQFYLFYKNKFRQESPEFEAVLSISAILFFVLMGILSVLFDCFLERDVDWVIYAIMIAIPFVLYKCYISSNRWKRILIDKPVVKSEKCSVVVAVAFFIVGLLFLFGAPLVGRYINLGSPW